METSEFRYVHMLQFINEFKENFQLKFGVAPHVIIEEHLKVKPQLSLKELETRANKQIDLNKYPQGVKTRTRKAEVREVRQCVCKLAREMGFIYEDIGNYFGCDHSTVLHSCRVVDKYLQTKDYKILLIMSKLKDGIKNKFGNDGDV
jgi:hypothetical protein